MDHLEHQVTLEFEYHPVLSNLFEIQFAVIFGGMVLFFILESYLPRKDVKGDEAGRWLSNITVALFNHFFLIFFALFLINITQRYLPNSPILKAFGWSDITKFIIVLLVMEFVYYWLHRAYHKIPFLWRIHAVHHTDTEVDVTTSHRHHPFEVVVSTIVITPVVFLLGAPAITIALYNLVNAVFTLITHSNIKLPEKLDSVLRRFVATPDFHRLHHASDKQYTDSNYSGIVTWFDYLFKTATHIPYKEIPNVELGLDILRDKNDNRLDAMLLTPFNYTKQKKKAVEHKLA